MNSREGRSAEWVIAALSDLKGQIQARDLVRLLSLAANNSMNDKRWNDRCACSDRYQDGT